jgi:hypothetical protein
MRVSMIFLWALPLVILTFLGSAFLLTVSYLPIVVQDFDGLTASRQYADAFRASNSLYVVSWPTDRQLQDAFKLGLKIERLPGGHLTTNEQPGTLAALIAKFERGLAKKQSERFPDAIPDCPFAISREATAHFVSVRWVRAPVFSLTKHVCNCCPEDNAIYLWIFSPNQIGAVSSARLSDTAYTDRVLQPSQYQPCAALEGAWKRWVA